MGERDRAILMFNDRMLVIAIGLGAILGVGIRQADPSRLSWWFVAACCVGMVLVLAAGMRWNRWRERNALLGAAGFFVAVSISRSLWVFVLGGGLYLTYFVAFIAADNKKLFAAHDRATRLEKLSQRQKDDRDDGSGENR